MYRACVVAVTADPATTWLAIRAGAAEGHPLWAAAIDRWGLTGAMAVRAVAGWILIGGVWWCHRRGWISGWPAAVLTVVFAAVSVWNLTVAVI